MDPTHPDTQLWLIDLTHAAAVLFGCEATCSRLSQAEIARLEAIADPAVQRLRRAAYLAQRLALERHFGPALRGIDLPRDAHGRPHLPPGHTGSVSLAHTGDFALIATSSAPRIGVDLETPRPIRMSQSRRAIIEAAAAKLSPHALPLDPDARFLQSWTRLEALAKADGHGIGHVLTAIGAVGQPRTAPCDPTRQSAASVLAVTYGLHIHDLDVGPGLYAALAGSAQPPALNRVASDPSALLLPP